jgi:hypothetical protein
VAPPIAPTPDAPPAAPPPAMDAPPVATPPIADTPLTFDAPSTGGDLFAGDFGGGGGNFMSMDVDDV